VSITRYVRDGLALTTYAGPAEHNSPNSNSRTMVQITTWGGQYVGLTMDHWIDLVCFIRRLDHAALSILTTPEIAEGEAS
jgi:hypothetical protein